MNNKDNLLSVLETIFKWKRPILITCAVAAVGSIIISLLLTVYYQSTTVFFAASSDIAKPEHIAGTSAKDTDFYGNANDIDRVLTFAESNELADHIIAQFHLFEHYDIDSTAAKARARIRKAFRGLYEVQKTKRDAIELSIEDEDPQQSAAMANEARNKIDEIRKRAIKESLAFRIASFTKDLKTKEKQLAVLGDTLQSLRNQYGIFSTISQSEALASLSASSENGLTRTRARLENLRGNNRVPRDTITMLEAKVKGMQDGLDTLKVRITTFNEGLTKINALKEQYSEASEQLGLDKERLKQLQAAYNAELSTLILVEPAAVPDDKSRPVRSLIVIGTVFIAFIFSVLAILFLDTYKEVDWKKMVMAERER